MFSGVQNTPLRTSVWIEGSLTAGSSENCGILRHVPIIMTVKFSLGLQLYSSLDSFGTFFGEEERYFSSIFPVFFTQARKRLFWRLELWKRVYSKIRTVEESLLEEWNCGRESTRRLELWKRVYSKIGTVEESLLEEALAGGSVKNVFLKKQGCSKFTKSGLYYSWRFLWLFRNV